MGLSRKGAVMVADAGGQLSQAFANLASQQAVEAENVEYDRRTKAANLESDRRSGRDLDKAVKLDKQKGDLEIQRKAILAKGQLMSSILNDEGTTWENVEDKFKLGGIKLNKEELKSFKEGLKPLGKGVQQDAAYDKLLESGGLANPVPKSMGAEDANFMQNVSAAGPNGEMSLGSRANLAQQLTQGQPTQYNAAGPTVGNAGYDPAVQPNALQVAAGDVAKEQRKAATARETAEFKDKLTNKTLLKQKSMQEKKDANELTKERKDQYKKLETFATNVSADISADIKAAIADNTGVKSEITNSRLTKDALIGFATKPRFRQKEAEANKRGKTYSVDIGPAGRVNLDLVDMNLPDAKRLSDYGITDPQIAMQRLDQVATQQGPEAARAFKNELAPEVQQQVHLILQRQRAQQQAASLGY